MSRVSAEFGNASALVLSHCDQQIFSVTRIARASAASVVNTLTAEANRLLQAAGVDFAILGPRESCTGDPARRMGNEYVFQALAEGNIATLNDAGVHKIIANCPHCFNTLANEYPDFGGNYEVIHHTELLARLVREGRLEPVRDEGT